ncbi:MAG: UDP-2,3-diacylglucosamine diphosphatase [bacterium]
MTTAFISDIHLSAQRPDSIRRFEAFMRNATRHLRRLYILGDLFDYWVGDDGADALDAARAEAAIRAAVEGGVEVLFMHGNRDFLVGDEFAQRTGCRLLDDPARIRIEQRAFVLTHGDALCTDDAEHQAARGEMLSSKWRMAFLRQPLAQRLQTAAELRRRSERAKRSKSAAMMDVNQGAVEALMRAHDVDTLIHGHTHRPAVHHFELDDRPAWRYVLGDWGARNSALYCQRGTLGLKR